MTKPIGPEPCDPIKSNKNPDLGRFPKILDVLKFDPMKR